MVVKRHRKIGASISTVRSADSPVCAEPANGAKARRGVVTAIGVDTEGAAVAREARADVCCPEGGGKKRLTTSSSYARSTSKEIINAINARLSKRFLPHPVPVQARIRRRHGIVPPATTRAAA